MSGCNPSQGLRDVLNALFQILVGWRGHESHPEEPGQETHCIDPGLTMPFALCDRLASMRDSR